MNQSPHFTVALKGFVLAKLADGRSQHTLANYSHCLKHLTRYLNDPPIADIRIDHLRGFFVYLQTEYKPRNGRPLSNHTLFHYWVAIKSFFAWAAGELDITDRPDRLLKRPQYTPAEITPYTEQEIHALLKAAETTKPAATTKRKAFTMSRHTAARDVAIVLCLLDTGLRVSELARLRISDLNQETGDLKVDSFGAGRKSRGRHVYLANSSRRALWRYLKQRPDVYPSDPLFVTGRKKPMERGIIRQMITRMGQRAGVARASPHRFRHTFAIQFLRNGGNVFSLQRLLGHADLTMTQKYLLLAAIDSQEAHRSASPADRWHL